MKDKHNVILILVSSNWLIPYSGGSSKFLISFVYIFLPACQVFSVISLRSSILIIARFLLDFFSIFFFCLIILWLPEFFESFFMVAHQGINSFSKRPSRFFSDELMYSSSCISKWNSFYLIFFRWCYVFLDNFPSCFMIHKFSNSDIFKSINLFIRVILV